MKWMLAFLFLLLFVAHSAAQQTCNLELKNAPAFFNLRLGMTEEQVRDIFGKELKFKPKKKPQERTFFQNYIKKPAPAILPGVRALYLRFAEHKLYQIEFFYENQDNWQTVADFTESVSLAQNFPNTFWMPVKNRVEARCVGFTLVADKVLNPRIELTDEAISSARLAAAAARQKKH